MSLTPPPAFAQSKSLGLNVLTAGIGVEATFHRSIFVPECLSRGVQPGFEGCCAPAHSGEDREHTALWKTTSKPGRSRTGRHSPACRFPTGEVSPSEARGSTEVRNAKGTAWNLSRELGRVVLGCCGVTGGRELVNALRR